jgi:hypothetical protein
MPGRRYYYEGIDKSDKNKRSNNNGEMQVRLFEGAIT